MSQIYSQVDAYTYSGDENPMGWFPGEGGNTFIDTVGNVIYKWVSPYTWVPFSIFDGNYGSLSNLPILFSGKYADLTGKPSLFDGNYNSLTNKPSLFNGDYNGLTNKPSIPSKLTLTNPVSRTIAKATAYQAIDNTKPAVITVTLTSTSSVSLTGSVSNAANILIGTNNAVASGTGTIVGKYNNVLGGTLIVGLNLTNTQTCSYTINLPIGGYFSIIQTTGSGVTIDSVVEQVLNLA